MTSGDYKSIEDLRDYLWNNHTGVIDLDESEIAMTIALTIATNKNNVHALIEKAAGKKFVDAQIVEDIISLMICGTSGEDLICDDCQHYIEDTTAGEECGRICVPKSLDSSEERLVAFAKEQIKAVGNG